MFNHKGAGETVKAGQTASPVSHARIAEFISEQGDYVDLGDWVTLF